MSASLSRSCSGDSSCGSSVDLSGTSPGNSSIDASGASPGGSSVDPSGSSPGNVISLIRRPLLNSLLLRIFSGGPPSFPASSGSARLGHVPSDLVILFHKRSFVGLSMEEDLSQGLDLPTPSVCWTAGKLGVTLSGHVLGISAKASLSPLRSPLLCFRAKAAVTTSSGVANARVSNRMVAC